MVEASQLPASGEGEVRGGRKSEARASGSVFSAEPLSSPPHQGRVPLSLLPEAPAAHSSITGSACSFPLGLVVGPQAPQGRLFLLCPLPAWRGETRCASRKGAEQFFLDKAVRMLPPHPAPSPLKVMLTMREGDRESADHRCRAVGALDRSCTLRSVWKGP